MPKNTQQKKPLKLNSSREKQLQKLNLLKLKEKLKLRKLLLKLKRALVNKPLQPFALKQMLIKKQP